VSYNKISNNGIQITVIKNKGIHTKGTIKENFDSINEISGRSNGPENFLKDFEDIRAFNNASTI